MKEKQNFHHHNFEQLSARSQNALRNVLSSSTCIFQAETVAPLLEQIDDLSLKSFMRSGGNIEQHCDLDKAAIRLEINHGIMDAFGGLYVLSTSPTILDSLDQSETNFGERHLFHIGYQIKHYWMTASCAKSSNDRSFTQRFLSSFLERSPSLESLDICVNCDDVTKMSGDKIQGNSLGLVKIAKQKLEVLTKATKGDWLLFLRKRAMRSITACTANIQEPSRVLISSLGNLNRLPWFSTRIRPENFMMAPTPAHNAINIVTWSSANRLALTVCSPLDQDFKHLNTAAFEAWEDLLS